MPDTPRCFRCLRPPADIPEIAALCSWRFPSPDAVARAVRTFNPTTATFACPPCLAAIGGDAATGPGWRAPRALPARLSDAVINGEVG